LLGIIISNLIRFRIDELLEEFDQGKYPSQLELFGQLFRRKDLDEEKWEIEKEERRIRELTNERQTPNNGLS
jgi:hypothetical protein